MSMQTIIATLESFAAKVVADAVAEAGAVGIKLLDIAKHAAEDTASAVANGFEELVHTLGEDATKLVTDLMADDSLKGVEKANLAAVQLTEIATTRGIEVASQDITTLIKNAYLVVKTEIAKL